MRTPPEMGEFDGKANDATGASKLKASAKLPEAEAT
jgi:hypothetical protein